MTVCKDNKTYNEVDSWLASSSVTTSGLVTLDRAEAVLERMETVNVTVPLPANETAKGNATVPPPAKATGQVHDAPCFNSVARVNGPPRFGL